MRHQLDVSRHEKTREGGALLELHAQRQLLHRPSFIGQVSESAPREGAKIVGAGKRWW